MLATPNSTTNPKVITPEAQRRRGWRELRDRAVPAPRGFEPRPRPVATLAIDPGSRKTGIAVFEGTELVDYRVKDFGHQRKTDMVLLGTRRLTEDLIRYFRPQVLVLERTFGDYQNKDVSKLLAVVREIKNVAREHSLPIVEYAPRTARLIVVGDGNATKREVAETVCVPYPELQIHLEQTHLWKDTFWSNMYDAVCVGLAFLIEKRLASAPTRPAPPWAA